MNFDEYQKLAITTDTGDGIMHGLTHPLFLEKAFGLVGEAGEFAEKLKKLLRDDKAKNLQIDEEARQEMLKELGDVLWYISALAKYLDKPLSELAADNLEKVLSRKTRGITLGSGDNR